MSFWRFWGRKPEPTPKPAPKPTLIDVVADDRVKMLIVAAKQAHRALTSHVTPYQHDQTVANLELAFQLIECDERVTIPPIPAAPPASQGVP